MLKKITKTNQSKNNFLSLPNDCIGVVLNFVKESQNFFSLLSVCKELYEILQRKDFVGAQHVEFRIKRGNRAANEIVRNYVRCVVFEDCFITKAKIKSFFRIFPRIEKLNISQCKMIDDPCLSQLGQLKELDISSCPSVRGKCLVNFPNLQTLTISSINLQNFKRKKNKLFSGLKIKYLKFVHDPSFMLNPPLITKKLMKHFKSVNRIFAKQCQIGKGDVFKHQKNLRWLDLTRCNRNVSTDITDKLIKDLHSLEVLKINNIQYRKSEKSKELVCGKLTITAFRYLHSLKHLEINHNWELDPEIISSSTLPNLKILHVRGCSTEMCRKALEISHRLHCIKICVCQSHKPVIQEEDNIHYELVDPAKVKDSCGSVYKCPNCSKCEKCKKDIDVNVSIYTCSDCKKLICRDCKRSGFCELCSGCYCKDCRNIKFFACICSCEYESLCHVCLKQHFLRCQKCGENRICDTCGRGCKKCGKIVCDDCCSPYDCNKCEKELRGSLANMECNDCFENVKCYICMKTRPILDINFPRYFSNEYQTLCEDCCGTCPICNKTVCISSGMSEDCTNECNECEKWGCRKCLELKRCYVCFESQCETCCKKENTEILYCDWCKECIGCSLCLDMENDILICEDEEHHVCQDCQKKCDECKQTACPCSFEDDDEEDSSDENENAVCKKCKRNKKKKK